MVGTYHKRLPREVSQLLCLLCGSEDGKKSVTVLNELLIISTSVDIFISHVTPI